MPSSRLWGIEAGIVLRDKATSSNNRSSSNNTNNKLVRAPTEPRQVAADTHKGTTFQCLDPSSQQRMNN